jgi:hypothetical protein
MTIQRVALGITQSGQHGLFTCGYLACTLTAEQYAQFSADRDALEEYATRRGFLLEDEE